MTYSLSEAESLAKLVKETGLVFAVTYNYTGNSIIRHARQLFRSGLMGTVRKVIIEYLQDCLMLPLEKQGVKQAVWRVDPKQAGLVGIMGDAGTHCENLIEYIIGEPITEVCADFSTFVPERVLDEDANLLFRLKGGGKGIMTVSQVCTGEENGLRLKIYASEGAIIWEQENPNYMYLYKYGQPRQILDRAHKEYLSEESFTCTRVPPGHPEGYLEAFANIYCKIFDAIRSHIVGEPLQMDKYDFPSVIDG
jgi:predicted dehydrogenase